ncbi:peptidase M23 [Desertibacillus haloalkaliphilus]|uniref:peptidase M23 n=1 Tax=Desertibacillus haloalkaliphilus TaxID=1328930 RepID=UPI001C26AE50|nr:peptidase M23 [Desertibacillus haloalkaliphilus]MBU8908052.1 peptidase M23 [Desertibacillus haloalkaliphilus]
MSSALQSFFLVALFAGIMTLQWNIETDMTSTRYLKNYGEIAVHDAALLIDQKEMSNGYLVFYKENGNHLGEEYLHESLKYHLRLDDNLVPEENSFFQHEVKIAHLQFIDDKTSDSVCNQTNADGYVRFPCTYDAPEFDFKQTLRGPSVVLILETEGPRYFRGESIMIRQAAVYEYLRN